jgi:hypothetical protein
VATAIATLVSTDKLTILPPYRDNHFLPRFDFSRLIPHRISAHLWMGPRLLISVLAMRGCAKFFMPGGLRSELDKNLIEQVEGH